MNRLIQKTVDKYNMLSCGDRVLAAVSGGADSMAMLSYLISVREKYSLSIIVAHMEHGIRGSESLEDAEFVKAYCQEHNIECIIKHIDAPKEAETASMGIEEYSRKRRYEFFSSVSCDKIATAHNLSDNAETVIFRLARGTGLKGMCGILPVRGKIIRPLIELSSDKIREHCRIEGIPYRIDSTNNRNDYSRNLIRNEIIPLLKKVNDATESSVCAFAKSAGEDYAFIEKSADWVFNDCLDENGLSAKKLKSLDKAISKRVILKYFESFGITLDRLHLDEIFALLEKPSRRQLQGERYAVSNKKHLRLVDLSHKSNDVNLIKEVLNISKFQAKDIDFYCDCDKIIGDIIIRKRQPGDKIRPAFRGCEKTLKKLFNEVSYPLEKRDLSIVVCDASGIIGVVGICADERVAVDKNTKNILSIKFPTEEQFNE